MSKVRYWETRNDANHNNRWAEALGVVFFAFPYQCYQIDLDQREKTHGKSATVADGLDTRGSKVRRAWFVNIYKPHPTKPGNRVHIEYKDFDFDDKDEAFLWAAQEALK